MIGFGTAPGVPAANAEVSTIANPPVSSAKYARLPSLVIVSECRPPVV